MRVPHKNPNCYQPSGASEQNGEDESGEVPDYLVTIHNKAFQETLPF